MSDLKKRIFDIIKKPQVMALATLTKDSRPWVRYMYGRGFEDLRIIFPTFPGSRKAAQIEQNPEVHITCGASNLEDCSEYLQIAGRAKISSDPKLKLLIWNDALKAYYTGPDDPNYCLCIVTPYHIELNSMEATEAMIWEAE